MIDAIASIKTSPQLEYIEAAHWAHLYSGRTGQNCFGRFLPGVFAGALPKVDILGFNRVIGAGLERPLRREELRDCISFFEQAGSRRFFLQLSPGAIHPELPAWLEQEGFRHYNNWTKLWRPIRLVVLGKPNRLRVEKIGPDQSRAFGQLICRCFDWENRVLAGRIAQTVGRSGFHHYLVKKEGKAVAAGSLFVEGEWAALIMAGTLPEFRGLGAQQLLIDTRIRKARSLGARHMVVETAEETPEKPVTSYRNLVRNGFLPVYQRQNWIYVIGA